MQTITLKVNGISGAKFLEKAKNILNSLRGQPAFDFLTIKDYEEGEKIEIPFWDQLDDLITRYEEALEKSYSRSKVSVEYLKQTRKELHKLLTVIKFYLITYYGTDLIALASTGFDLSKKSVPYGKLSKPKNFKLMYDNKGGVIISFNRVPGASSYIIEYRATDAINWNSLASTKVKYVLNGLEHSKTYEIRVKGIGAHPTHVYSDILTIIAP